MKQRCWMIVLMTTVLYGCTLKDDNQIESPVIEDELSEVFETEHGSQVQSLTHYIQAIDNEVTMKVYVPENYNTDTEYPVLFLLHGQGANEDTVMQALQIQKEVDRMIKENKIRPALIVVPTYTRFQLNFELDREIYEELIDFIDSKYSTIGSREGRYIGGFSLGGLHSLYFTFENPDLFSKVGGHMPAIHVEGRFNERLQEHDPLKLAEHAHLADVQIYLDCGDQDEFGFYNGTEELYRILNERGLDVEYHLNPGNHSNEYLSEHLEEYMTFYLGI